MVLPKIAILVQKIDRNSVFLGRDPHIAPVFRGFKRIQIFAQNP
jgi:hypothetical protein